MASTILTGHYTSDLANTPVVIMGQFETLYLASTGLIATIGLNSPAIRGTSSSLRIHGEVFAGSGVGVEFVGDGGNIYIAETGYIDTQFGAVYSTGGFLRLTNRGVLQGGNVGVAMDGGGNTVQNFGEIYSHGLGNAAVSFGVTGLTGYVNDLYNYGAIFGSVEGGSDRESVLNVGTIHGPVSLGDGQDSFDSRRGTLTYGTVNGAGGNDFIYGSKGDEAFLGGGAGNDSIRGMRGEDQIYGGTENDTLWGLGDDDTIFGQEGNDLLIGGLGADALDGGANFDTASYQKAAGGVVAYLLAAYANSGEAAGDSYVGIEALVGSKFNDRLTGDHLSNRLDGESGVDTLSGARGDDSYVVDNLSDLVVESANFGNDTVFATVTRTLEANVEHLIFQGSSVVNGTGNTLDNFVRGNAASNVLNGLTGNDTVAGGFANDTLTGGAGLDTFFFDTAANTNSNCDRITDFNVAADTIQIDNADFGGLPSVGLLAAGAFRIGAAAADADDRIIYNSATGALFHDADGNGGVAAVRFALLATGLGLTSQDFIIV